MRNGYVDNYVVCPLYSREESNEHRKIHCAGHKKGVYMQIYFRRKELKREHKNKFCKNINEYKKCPLYSGVIKCMEENDE